MTPTLFAFFLLQGTLRVHLQNGTDPSLPVEVASAVVVRMSDENELGRDTLPVLKGEILFPEADTNHFYRAEVSYKGVLYETEVIRGESGETLRVFEPTESMDSLRILRHHMPLLRRKEGILITEILTVENLGRRTYVGPPFLSFTFPSGVDFSPIEPPSSNPWMSEGETLRLDWPFPPGPKTVAFNAGIPDKKLELTRLFPIPLVHFDLFLNLELDLVEGNLNDLGTRELGGESYKHYTATPGREGVRFRVAWGSSPRRIPFIPIGLGFILILVIFFMRKRKPRPPGVDLVEKLAELERARERGEIGEEEYRARKDALKTPQG